MHEARRLALRRTSPVLVVAFLTMLGGASTDSKAIVVQSVLAIANTVMIKTTEKELNGEAGKVYTASGGRSPMGNLICPFFLPDGTSVGAPSPPQHGTSFSVQIVMQSRAINSKPYNNHLRMSGQHWYEYCDQGMAPRWEWKDEFELVAGIDVGNAQTLYSLNRQWIKGKTAAVDGNGNSIGDIDYFLESWLQTSMNQMKKEHSSLTPAAPMYSKFTDSHGDSVPYVVLIGGKN